jgi:hypothetical protein
MAILVRRKIEQKRVSEKKLIGERVGCCEGDGALGRA